MAEHLYTTYIHLTDLRNKQWNESYTKCRKNYCVKVGNHDELPVYVNPFVTVSFALVVAEKH